MHHRYSQNTCIPHKICETEAKTEKELTIWYEWSTIKLTSIRLFRCQCRSCSCWVRLGVGEGVDMYWPIDLCMSFELSWPETFSCKAGRLLQSRGQNLIASCAHVYPAASCQVLCPCKRWSKVLYPCSWSNPEATLLYLSSHPQHEHISIPTRNFSICVTSCNIKTIWRLPSNKGLHISDMTKKPETRNQWQSWKIGNPTLKRKRKPEKTSRYKTNREREKGQQRKAPIKNEKRKQRD